jgi:hypothetical protein
MKHYGLQFIGLHAGARVVFSNNGENATTAQADDSATKRMIARQSRA